MFRIIILFRLTSVVQHVCVLDTRGIAQCIGAGTVEINGPQQVPGGFVLLEAAHQLTCGVPIGQSTQEAIVCFGNNATLLAASAASTQGSAQWVQMSLAEDFGMCVCVCVCSVFARMYFVYVCLPSVSLFGLKFVCVYFQALVR